MNAALIDTADDASATAWWFLDTLVVEHRRAEQMTGIVLEMTLPVGHAPALHIHDTLDDNWYVMEGQLAARCGEDEYLIETGAWVSMPRGIPHGFRVVGEQPARILVVHDNSTFRDFVRELSTPAAHRVPPQSPAFPPMDQLARVAANHDLRPVGPPMTPDEAMAISARARAHLQPAQ